MTIKVEIAETIIPGNDYKIIPLNYTVPDGYKSIAVISYNVLGSTSVSVLSLDYKDSSIIIANVSSIAAKIGGHVIMLLERIIL